MLSLTALSRFLSTSAGSVSSSRMLGPCLSGPNAQTALEASTSQLYLSLKKSVTFFLGQSRLMCPCSMSLSRPCHHHIARVSIFTISMTNIASASACAGYRVQHDRVTCHPVKMSATRSLHDSNASAHCHYVLETRNRNHKQSYGQVVPPCNLHD